MSSTKKAILRTALTLFNQKGLAKVTLRSIANEMGMSQGNLNYHFKKREDIIEALYFQLVQNMDESMAKLATTNNLLEMMFTMSQTVMNNFYDYRFFLLDFVQIIRENEKIKNHYSNLTAQREEQFAAFFNALVLDGIMRKEAFENEYKNMYKRSQILGDFWISSATITSKELSKEVIQNYSEIINQSIFPYLTEKGRRVWFEVVDQSKLGRFKI